MRSKQIGNLGEELAAQHYHSCGHTIIDRNYAQVYGEIDIVTRRTGRIHFIEVKTVSYETEGELKADVSRETTRLEDRVTPKKRFNINRAIESWLTDHAHDVDWQFDIASVFMVPKKKLAVMKVLDNIID